MQIDLHTGDVPYLALNIQTLELFVPFRHTLQLFTKSPEHHRWSFDGDVFSSEDRRIRDWEWILALDRSYKHGSMIRCMNETIHGNRVTLHCSKHYRLPVHCQLDVSMDIGETGPRYFEEVTHMVDALETQFPERVVREDNVDVVPDGRVSLYTMNCLTYTHA